VNAPTSGCEDLLRAATVALEVRAQPGGRLINATGFFVAPGIVATCAHVLSDTRAELPVQVVGRLASGVFVPLETVPEWYTRAEPGGLDLAFLRAVHIVDVPHVLLAGAVALRDPMWTYGHPAGQFQAGQSAGFRYQGPSRLRADSGQWEPLRLTGTPVGGGYSGSPVLNLRTGAVCGMLCTSDEAGSAHMVSADDIIAGLLMVKEAQAANARWLGTLSDEQIGNGGWRFPGPRLRAYLDAAGRAAAEHPYPGVVPGITPPPLTAVYVRQQAEAVALTDDEPPGQAPSDLQGFPAEEILTREQDCVLIGGPGAGKSSLLRTALISVAVRWQRGEGGAEIPIHVLASDLLPPNPLPDLIAAGVTASLSAVGILRSWPAEFFAEHPLRDVRWLVLVDGLDEVLDPVARRRILDKIAGARKAESGAPYRFVVTTRPLPDSEFPPQVNWPAPRFELQLFAADQLAEFAERWFTELRLPQPHQAARDFIVALDGARLTDPARTPLMAAMLCQLFAANQDRALPTGRAGAYKEFVDLLRRRQYEDSTSGIFGQMQALLGPYGPSATGPAGMVLANAMNLIARLAVHRQEGGEGPTIDLLAGWTLDERPQHVPEQPWRSFLREILRRSGLLTQRANDFQFIHQTVAEFLAAQYATADPDRRSVVYQGLFGNWKSGVWTPPPWDESYSRFLVALWPDKSSVTKALHHLAAEGGVPGCRFIASLVADSALPEVAIETRAAATLAAFAGKTNLEFHLRREACEILAQLRDPRGADLLAELATETALNEASRRQAAETLARLGDGRGADLLAVQAGPSASDKVARLWAAESLARLGDPRSVERLAALVEDSELTSENRKVAIRTLTRIFNTGRADQVAAVAIGEHPMGPNVRYEAVLAFARLADHHHADSLVVLTADKTIAEEGRARVAEALVRIGDHRAADLLATLAGEATADGTVRLGAAVMLTEIHDSRSAAFLAALAAEAGTVSDPIRRQAAEALFRLDCTDLLLDLAVKPTGNPDTRYGAAEALAWISPGRRISALTSLATDPTATPGIRLRAGRALILAGDRHGPDLVAALAAEPTLDMSTRCAAAWIVAQAGDRRAKLVRQILVSADSTCRHQAAATLAELTGDQAGRLLEPLTVVRPIEPRRQGFERVMRRSTDILGSSETLDRLWARHRRFIDNAFISELPATPTSIDPVDWPCKLFNSRNGDQFAAVASEMSLDDFPRRRAAEAIAWLGDPRGLDILVALAANGSIAPYARVDAAAALGRLGDDRAIELLVAVARDDSVATIDRFAAAAALALVDTLGSARWLTAMATDRSLDGDTRRVAAEMLTRLTAAGTGDLLAGVAADIGGDPASIGVAEALTRLGDERGKSVLASLVDDPSCDALARVEAAEALVSIDPVRGATCLARLAADRALDSDSRASAAEALARSAELSIGDQLATLAADSALPVCSRIEVGEALARLGDPRAAAALKAIADDPTHDAYARKWASEALT
jgi:HEAT repeat protein